MNRKSYIEFFRAHGFNCFPIKEGQKIADGRYKAEATHLNQEITEKENFGYIPIRGKGTAILDFDDKEIFKDFVQDCINKNYFVTESPHGWHVPVTNFSGEVSKIELYHPVTDKKVIDIQGPKQYCVGPECVTPDGVYKPHNGNIYNMGGKDFNNFVDWLQKKFNLKSKKQSKQQSFKLREKFKEGKIPTDGQSNDYFFQACLVCNTEGLSKEDASNRIRKVYDDWVNSKFYSGRPWSNIEAKLDEVYDNNFTIEHGGHNKKEKQDGIMQIVEKIQSEYTLFSDPETRQLFATNNGFKEDVTIKMEKLITNEYETDRHDTAEIIHMLIGKADDMPPVSYDYIMFKDRMYDVIHNIDVDKDPSIICAVGFKDYNYIPNPQCPKFLKLIDEHVEEESRNNLFATLSNVAVPHKQTRMGMFYGPPGTGKTTLAETIIFSLGESGYAMKISDFISDRAHESKLRGKTCMYFQDAPRTLKDIEKLKVSTGENLLSVRDMYKKAEGVRNMLTVLITSNHLIEIDKDEEGPMYDRLALIKFHGKVRDSPQEIDQYSLEIARDEGEQIISYCLNLRCENYKFDSSEMVKQQWREIANPEEKLIRENFYYSEDSEGMNIFEILTRLQQKYKGVDVDVKALEKAIVNQGYTKSKSLYLGIKFIEKSKGQEILG